MDNVLFEGFEWARRRWPVILLVVALTLPAVYEWWTSNVIAAALERARLVAEVLLTPMLDSISQSALPTSE